MEPYAYRNQPDGVEVGKYTPQYKQAKPQAPRVTKDRFTDTRKKGAITLPREKLMVDQECTKNRTI